MRTLSVSVTAAGSRICDRLPYEHVHGNAGDVVRERWSETDAFVLALAVGAAVRIVGPLLRSKESDPAVVCVDDSGRFVVSLTGGHSGGANDLAKEVATLIGAEPVVTTASDASGAVAFDDAVGFSTYGDIASLTRSLLEGAPVNVDNRLGWPLPHSWQVAPGNSEAAPALIVTDERLSFDALSRPAVVANPPSLVVGIGTSSDASEADVRELLEQVLDVAGLAFASVGEIATIDRRSDHRSILAFGLPVRSFSAELLSEVEVSSPSHVVEAAVGTPSVAEAACMLAAGPAGTLVVGKRKSDRVTIAIARRSRPRGLVSVVGIGPGSADHRTPAASTAIRRAEVVVGYSGYLAQVEDLIGPSQVIVHSDLGSEIERARTALDEASLGRRVAMVCSGDAGVYAMASPLLELAGDPGYSDVEISVVPGVTASLATASVLGAPLGHDHLTISLSDLLTPWEVIESRLAAAANADLVVVIYNPRSLRRNWQLDKAREMLLTKRKPDTPVGVVTDAGRRGQTSILTTLEELDTSAVTMTSCVVVGSTTTRIVNGRMVTPRGYLP